jgi:hypothetical protein
MGMGLALVSGTILAVRGVPQAQSGLASGLLNTSRLVGGALGLAVLSTIAAGRTRAETAHTVRPLLALTDGFGLAFAVGAGFCLLGAAAAVVLLRPARPPVRGDDPVDRPFEVELELYDAPAVEEPVGV